jgi:hypothetical protein
LVSFGRSAAFLDAIGTKRAEKRQAASGESPAKVAYPTAFT